MKENSDCVPMEMSQWTYHRVSQLTYHRAPVAQLVEHRAVTREVVSSSPAGPTLRVFKQLRRKCCLCNYICKWLDSLVFSDKDNKPEVQSHNPSLFIILWGGKVPAHLSQRVGHVVPDVVVCVLWCIIIARENAWRYSLYQANLKVRG